MCVANNLSMSIATEQEFCGINCVREVRKPFYYYFVLKFVIPGLFLLFFLRQHKYIDFILSVLPN